jgi:hypothetical protein
MMHEIFSLLWTDIIWYMKKHVLNYTQNLNIQFFCLMMFQEELLMKVAYFHIVLCTIVIHGKLKNLSPPTRTEVTSHTTPAISHATGMRPFLLTKK